MGEGVCGRECVGGSGGVGVWERGCGEGSVCVRECGRRECGGGGMGGGSVGVGVWERECGG